MKTKETKQLNKVERFNRLVDIATMEYHSILWTISTDDEFKTLEWRIKHLQASMHLLKCFGIMRGEKDPQYNAYSLVRWEF